MLGVGARGNAQTKSVQPKFGAAKHITGKRGYYFLGIFGQHDPSSLFNSIHLSSVFGIWSPLREFIVVEEEKK